MDNIILTTSDSECYRTHPAGFLLIESGDKIALLELRQNISERTFKVKYDYKITISSLSTGVAINHVESNGIWEDQLTAIMAGRTHAMKLLHQ